MMALLVTSAGLLSAIASRDQAGTIAGQSALPVRREGIAISDLQRGHPLPKRPGSHCPLLHNPQFWANTKGTWSLEAIDGGP